MKLHSLEMAEVGLELGSPWAWGPPPAPYLAPWLPGCPLAGLPPGRYEWERPMERSELMDDRAAAGWPETWVIRTPVFYDFSGRGERAHDFSKEVNAKTESLPAETGAVGTFS